jgi:hypothetical protein
MRAALSAVAVNLRGSTTVGRSGHRISRAGGLWSGSYSSPNSSSDWVTSLMHGFFRRESQCMGLDPSQYSAADRREVDPPIAVETATWSNAVQLDWWVKERQEWWGRVRGCRRPSTAIGSLTAKVCVAAAANAHIPRLTFGGKPIRLRLAMVARWTLSVQPTCTPRVGPCARSVPSWAFPGLPWVINFAVPA